MKLPMPLGDKIIARVEAGPAKIGLIIIPPNQRQGLRTHHRAVVLAAGHKAAERCPPGTIVHVSESWGEHFMLDGKRLTSGRLRDINFILEGESVAATNAFLD